MDESSGLISEKVKDGTYFSDAKEWYYNNFAYPLMDRTTLLGIMVVLCALIMMTAYSIYSIFPLQQKVNVVVVLEDTANFYARAEKIHNSGKSTATSVMEYLCSKYVIAREGYNYLRYKPEYRFILNSSARPVFQAYYDKIKTTNTESPLVKYKKNDVVNVNIISEKVDADKKNATIDFEKLVYDNNHNLVSKTQHRAYMEFYISKYDFNQSVNAKLDFIVTKYDVQDVLQANKKPK